MNADAYFSVLCVVYLAVDDANGKSFTDAYNLLRILMHLKHIIG